MAETITRDNLVDFSEKRKVYFVAFDNGADSTMHFIAKAADINTPFTTEPFEALPFTDENTACMFANLINNLYKDKECYIVELSFDFTFCLPYDVDTYIKRARNVSSAD